MRNLRASKRLTSVLTPVPLIIAAAHFAAAEQENIKVTIATISQGNLLVVGYTTPTSPVTLPEIGASTTAASDGLFMFSVKFHPPKCLLKIATPAMTISAAVSDCGQEGPAGARGAAGPPGLVGYERIQQQCDQAALIMGYCLAACPSGKVIFGGSCSGGKFVTERSGADPNGEQWRCFAQLPVTPQIISQAFCAAVTN
jgi:hypothetical protein